MPLRTDKMKPNNPTSDEEFIFKLHDLEKDLSMQVKIARYRERTRNEYALDSAQRSVAQFEEHTLPKIRKIQEQLCPKRERNEAYQTFMFRGSSSPEREQDVSDFKGRIQLLKDVKKSIRELEYSCRDIKENSELVELHQSIFGKFEAEIATRHAYGEVYSPAGRTIARINDSPGWSDSLEGILKLFVLDGGSVGTPRACEDVIYFCNGLDESSTPQLNLVLDILQDTKGAGLIHLTQTSLQDNAYARFWQLKQKGYALHLFLMKVQGRSVVPVPYKGAQ